MPRLSIVTAALTIIIATTEARSESEGSISVEALSRLDVAREVSLSTSASRPWFFAVSGYSLDLPGVGRLNYEMCFEHAANVREVTGTTDFTRSSDELVLQKRAGLNASEFNRQVAIQLQMKGLSRCKTGVDWNQSFGEISRAFSVEGLSEISLDLDKRVPTIIVLRPSADRDADAKKICQMANERGLSPLAVRFLIDPVSKTLSSRSWDCAAVSPGVPKGSDSNPNEAAELGSD